MTGLEGSLIAIVAVRGGKGTYLYLKKKKLGSFFERSWRTLFFLAVLDYARGDNERGRGS